MENTLPGPEAMKAEREEATQELKAESEEEPLAALPAFPVPVTDNDAPKECQQAKEPMKLFEFVHHTVDADNKDHLQQIQIDLAGDPPYQHPNMQPNQGNLLEDLNALEESLNKVQDLLETEGLLPAPCQEKSARTVKRTVSFVNMPPAPDGTSTCLNITYQQSFEDLLSDISQLETIGGLLTSAHE